MKYKDLPRDELMARANHFLVQMGDFAEVHFKFSCENCGERCELTEPNTLYERGECCKCGHETVITKGGFSIHMRLGPE
jgi:hypothetical protein